MRTKASRLKLPLAVQIHSLRTSNFAKLFSVVRRFTRSVQQQLSQPIGLQTIEPFARVPLAILQLAQVISVGRLRISHSQGGVRACMQGSIVSS
jgi:hypothetical protein